MTSADPLPRYTNEAVGAFVLVTVLVFAVALLQTGRIREWFDPGATIKVVLPDAGLFGLAEGADVEILGTKAGQVRRIIIDPDQQMHAEIHIRGDMLDFVRRDSEATIRKRFGVAGDAFLEITRGMKEPLDWQYAVLNASADRAPTETMGEVIAEVRTKVLPAIDQADRAVRGFADIAETFSNPEGDLQQLLANLNAVASRIERGEGAVGRLLVEAKLAFELEALLAQTNASMARVGPILDELQVTARSMADLGEGLTEQSKSLPQVTKRAEAVLVSLDAVLKDLRRTTPELPRITQNMADATESMPALLMQTQETAAELEKLVRQIRSNWLLGGGADNAPRPTSRISPLDVNP